MRHLVFGFILAATSSLPALAEDCSKDVVAAINKQHASKAFRIETTQQSAAGPIDMKVDYLPPDRMKQTLTGGEIKGTMTTILVGERAFSGENGSYEELLPQFTQSIFAEFKRTLESPSNVQAFECQGKVTFEGKTYLGYRRIDTTRPDAKPEETLARTVYVDPETGLPIFNVVARLAGDSTPLVKVSYSYPTDVVIEAPVGAPIQKRPH